MELGDILRKFLPGFLKTHKLSEKQHKVAKAIMKCRTGELGAHVSRCDNCGYEEISYNSCRDRHCPKCQHSKRFEWVANQMQSLLPVPYFHTVFTLPHILNPLLLLNKELLYNLFFDCASGTLKTFGADPDRLGGKIGFIALLHTWGQTLAYHVHLHFIIPAGALSFDGAKWIRPKYEEDFLFPVRAMSKVMRGKFISGLRELHDQLKFEGDIAYLKNEVAFEHFLDDLSRKMFRVHSRKPFAKPDHVLKYIGRYTHRVAIANSRILEVTDNEIAFSYKDYKDDNRKKVMRLSPNEFIRRFMLHVLPKGFQKIRHYGFLAGSVKKEKIKLIRKLLSVATEAVEKVEDIITGFVCPECGKGVMERVKEVCGEVLEKAFPIALSIGES